MADRCLEPFDLGLGLLVLTAAFAGCVSLEDPNPFSGLETSTRLVEAPVAEDTRSSDEYWMVTVTGNETDPRDAQAVCMRVLPPYEVHQHNQSLEIAEERYDFYKERVQAAMVLDHEDRSSQCPEIERLVIDPAANFSAEMGEYGDVSFHLLPDGTVRVDETEVPLGKALIVTYEGDPEGEADNVEGSFRVHNHGAWDQGDIWVGNPHHP